MKDLNRIMRYAQIEGANYGTPDLIPMGRLVSNETLAALQKAVPNHLVCDSESTDIDSAGNFLGCVNTAWHHDQHCGVFRSALLLVEGTRAVVETRTDRVEMLPGDAVLLNLNLEHRGTCPDGGYAIFFNIDFADSVPSVQEAKAALDAAIEKEIRLVTA